MIKNIFKKKAGANSQQNTWLSSLSAIIKMLNQSDPAQFDFIQWSFGYKKTTKSMLEQWWDITDKDSFYETTSHLKNVGHRTSVATALDSYYLVDPEYYNSLDRFEAVEHKTRVQSNYQNIFLENTDGFIAWDYCRYAWLYENGVTAGYVEKTEAMYNMVWIGKKLQEQYSSWQELGEDYLLGRQIWKLEINSNKTKLYRNGNHCNLFFSNTDDLIVYQKLLNNNDSPWSQTPWDTKLEYPKEDIELNQIKKIINFNVDNHSIETCNKIISWYSNPEDIAIEKLKVTATEAFIKEDYNSSLDHLILLKSQISETEFYRTYIYKYAASLFYCDKIDLCLDSINENEHSIENYPELLAIKARCLILKGNLPLAESTLQEVQEYDYFLENELAQIELHLAQKLYTKALEIILSANKDYPANRTIYDHKIAILKESSEIENLINHELDFLYANIRKLTSDRKYTEAIKRIEIDKNKFPEGSLEDLLSLCLYRTKRYEEAYNIISKVHDTNTYPTIDHKNMNSIFMAYCALHSKDLEKVSRNIDLIEESENAAVQFHGDFLGVMLEAEKKNNSNVIRKLDVHIEKWNSCLYNRIMRIDLLNKLGSSNVKSTDSVVARAKQEFDVLNYQSSLDHLINESFSAEVVRCRAYNYFCLEDYQTSFNQFQKINKKELILHDFMVMGYCLSQLNRLEDAEVSYKKATDQCDSNETIYHYLRAENLEKMGNIEKSLDVLLEAYKKDPSDHVVIDDIAGHYKTLEEYTLAEEYASMSITIDPEYAYPYSIRADANVELSNYTTALEDNEITAKLLDADDESSPGLFFQKAKILVALSRYKEAMKVINSILSHTDYSDIHELKADIYYKQNEYSNSYMTYLRSQELYGDDNDAYKTYIGIGKCLAKMGQRTDALVYFNEALRFDIDNEVRKEVKLLIMEDQSDNEDNKGNDEDLSDIKNKDTIDKINKGKSILSFIIKSALKI